MSVAATGSGGIELRPYQAEVVRQIYAAIRGGSDDVLVVAPTGSGKTAIATRLIGDAVGRGRRVVFVVTINTLIQQTLGALARAGLPLDQVGVIANRSAYPRDPGTLQRPIQVASLQTLARLPDLVARGWDLVIWDECHTSRWFGCADDLRANCRWSIGLTATPFRLKKSEGMSDKFSAAVLAPCMDDLTQWGFLAPLKYKGLVAVDTSRVSVRAGDFAQDQLSHLAQQKHTLSQQLDAWEAEASHLRTITFTVDVAHGEAVVTALRERGYRAALVTGDTPHHQRRQIFADFAGDEIQVLASCEALSTGFDVPNTECGLLLRPTQSRTVHLQQIGRVARPAPGKECGLILDAAGNVKRLGFPEDISRSLTPENVLATGQDVVVGAPPVKECPQCSALVHLAAQVCPECGHFFGKDKEEPIPAGKRRFVDLIRLESEADHRAYYCLLIRQAWEAGDVPSKAFAEYKRSHKTAKYPTPGWDWGRHAIFGKDWTDDDLRQFVARVRQAAQRNLRWRQDWQADPSKIDKWIAWQVRGEFGKRGSERLDAIASAPALHRY